VLPLTRSRKNGYNISVFFVGTVRSEFGQIEVTVEVLAPQGQDMNKINHEVI
jgi:hypothetical protein